MQRFLAAEADPHFERPRRSASSIRSTRTAPSSVAACFLPRNLSVVDIEMGVFGHKSYDRTRGQSAQCRQCFNITVGIFSVLGLLAWTVAVMIIVVQSQK